MGDERRIKDWNKLLHRQLKKHYGTLDSIPEALLPFLGIISATYHHYDKDRKMLERSIELSSAEMKELNCQLRKESEENNRALYGSLTESLGLLNEGALTVPAGSDYHQLTYVAEALKKETLKRKYAEEQRKITEKELVNVNRMFQVVSQINQMIVRVKSEEDIYNDACGIAVRYGRFQTAWVALVADNGDLAVKACDGAVADLPKLAEIIRRRQGEAIKNGQPDVCNHLGPGFPTDAAPTMCGSCMILPIRSSGAVIGAFNLYIHETGFFNEEETALLKNAAADMSFALDILRKERHRTRTEQQLQESERRLRQAQEIVHLGSWSLDFDSGTALWTKEALKIYGISMHETEQTYESWLSYIHPDDLDYVLQNVRQGQANFGHTAFFHRIVRKDGAVRHLYSQSEYELDEQGRPTGLYGVAYDVTDIKETEQALRNSQADLQAIFDNTSEGFMLTGLDGKVKTFNGKAGEIARLIMGREIRMGADVRELLPLHQIGTYGHMVDEAAAGKTVRREFPFAKADGAVEWFDFIVSPVRRAGKVVGLVIASSHITDRKLAELKLKESEKRYSGLFQLSPLPMWIYSQKDLRILDVNQAAIAHYGYTRKEFQALTIKDIRPPEDLSALEASIKKNKRKKRVVYQQGFRHQKKNGDVIQVEVQSRDLLYQGKKAKLIVARDVTERAHYIRAIEQQNEKLKEISWMQSHVVRAPLARIMALVCLMEIDKESPEDREQTLAYLKKSADDLDSVIMDIVDKAKTFNLGGKTKG